MPTNAQEVHMGDSYKIGDAISKSGNGMPVVTVYPTCMECKVPYVLRRVWVLKSGAKPNQWLWQRDWKHRTAGTRIANERG